MIKVLISLSESAYKEMCENGIEYVDYDIKQMMREGTPLPEGAEILTKEAYSDLCLRASQERKTGKWKTNSDFTDRLICSECSAQFDMWHWEAEQMNYCPHCGAKMKGAEE